MSGSYNCKRKINKYYLVSSVIQCLCQVWMNWKGYGRKVIWHKDGGRWYDLNELLSHSKIINVDARVVVSLAGTLHGSSQLNIESNFRAFSALTLLVGREEEHLARKKIEWWGTGVVTCLECGANDLHMVQLMPLPPIISCFSKIQNGSAFLVPAYQGCPGKRPLNVCVCVNVIFTILVRP